jgi:hypothetical protein
MPRPQLFHSRQMNERSLNRKTEDEERGESDGHSERSLAVDGPAARTASVCDPSPAGMFIYVT